MGSYANAYDEADETLGSPWGRFWARIFDTVVYSFPAGVLLGAAFPSLFLSEPFTGPGGDYLAGVVVLPVVMIIDALIISVFGTTLGKAIAGLSVRDLDDQKLSVEIALKRNLLVYGKGLVLGLPLLCLVGYSAGYNAIKNDGITSWDAETGTRVHASESASARTVLIGLLAILATASINAFSRLN